MLDVLTTSGSRFRALNIQYHEQQSDWGCGLALIQMLRRSLANSALTGWRDVEQHEIHTEVIRRRGRRGKAPSHPLPLPQISWLLRPLACRWMRHRTGPRPRFEVFEREINNRRPVILFVEPESAENGKAMHVGHVVLVTGYGFVPHHDELKRCLLLYDPQVGTKWIPAADCPESLVKANDNSHDGRHVVSFDNLNGSRLATTDRIDKMRWSQTGILGNRFTV